MKIKLSNYCWKCFQETDLTKESYQKLKLENNKNQEFLFELNDENLYEFI